MLDVDNVAITDYQVKMMECLVSITLPLQATS